MLRGHDPRDAVPWTQRLCGGCSTGHALAAAAALEAAFGVRPAPAARLVRNLVLGADFLANHIRHFYMRALPDYVAPAGRLAGPPWTPRWDAPDLISGPAAATLAEHCVHALDAARAAGTLGAILGGRLPMSPVFAAGGATHAPSLEHMDEFGRTLAGVRSFIDTTLLPDVRLVAQRFPQYYSLGAGPGRLLALGAFDLDDAGAAQLLPRGRYDRGKFGAVEPARVTEDVRHAWYNSAGSGRHPAAGMTVPDADKPGAYSWVKAARYDGRPYEVGPLARLWASGDYTRGISVMDRLLARALEAAKLAKAMDGWAKELAPGATVFKGSPLPQAAVGAGLAEGPGGAIGHWLRIDGGKIALYQVVSPAGWNASPRDDKGVPGPLEQALVGTPIKDEDRPIEVLRVAHSFDPCLACAGQ
jgi:hydrogenase large subunit